MLHSTKLATSYAIFALLATMANIGAQDLFLRIYSGAFDVISSIVVGTSVGLAIKYILDKRYIFRFQTRDAVHNGQTFALYTFMGIVTTFIFWAFELGFHQIFDTREMRYTGGILGLAVGYFMKYHLDKRYVFRTRPA